MRGSQGWDNNINCVFQQAFLKFIHSIYPSTRDQTANTWCILHTAPQRQYLAWYSTVFVCVVNIYGEAMLPLLHTVPPVQVFFWLFSVRLWCPKGHGPKGRVQHLGHMTISPLRHSSLPMFWLKLGFKGVQKSHLSVQTDSLLVISKNNTPCLYATALLHSICFKCGSLIILKWRIFTSLTLSRIEKQWSALFKLPRRPGAVFHLAWMLIVCSTCQGWRIPTHKDCTHRDAEMHYNTWHTPCRFTVTPPEGSSEACYKTLYSLT